MSSRPVARATAAAEVVEEAGGGNIPSAQIDIAKTVDNADPANIQRLIKFADQMIEDNQKALDAFV